MRGPLAVIGVTALAALAAAGGWLFFAEPRTDARESRAATPRAFPVEVATARQGRAATIVTATGTLGSSDSVDLQPDVPGRVIAVPFREGDAVAAGTPLIELDKVILQAELEKAEAALTLAQENFRRSDLLVRQRATATRALDEAQAALRNAEAEASLARTRLDRATIRAPFDGIVGLRDISVGRYVTVGDELLRIDRIDPLDLDFRIPERWLTKVRPGMPVRLAVDAVPDGRFEGTVSAVDPVIDVNGRSIRVRGTVANADRVLRPGLFARVALEVDVRPDAVLVPEKAVVLSQNGAAVFRIENGKAIATPVVTGVREDGMVEIVDGLAAGAEVVVNGHVRLRDGASVEIVTPAAEPSA
ncbi:MAG: efflux RND transporter periplasmic adaptor subunit [Geminicoccaceae bacterium]